MDRRAAEARVETLSNVFRVMGIAMALLPTMGGIPSSPLFLICAESLVTNEKDDWWNNVFLQPGSLRAAVSGKKYCFTENGRVRFR